MSQNTPSPKIGDAVLCDGALCLITDSRTRYVRETSEFLEAVQFENAQTKHYGLARDLRWSEDLQAWYLWGRCLSGPDVALVIELRDRGLLIARGTRTPGNPPAGGEHLDLYLTLMRGQPARFWDNELTQVRRGGSLSPAARERIVAFEGRWLGPHSDGYADPDEAPSTDTASQPKEG